MPPTALSPDATHPSAVASGAHPSAGRPEQLSGSSRVTRHASCQARSDWLEARALRARATAGQGSRRSRRRQGHGGQARRIRVCQIGRRLRALRQRGAGAVCGSVGIHSLRKGTRVQTSRIASRPENPRRFCRSAISTAPRFADESSSSASICVHLRFPYSEPDRTRSNPLVSRSSHESDSAAGLQPAIRTPSRWCRGWGGHSAQAGTGSAAGAEPWRRRISALISSDTTSATTKALPKM